MEIHTIGFTKSSAEDFFGRLEKAGIKRLIDVRLNNVSQLAGFAKRDDLDFFLNRLIGAKYLHEPLFAPTAELLSRYRKKEITWAEYESNFLDLLAERAVENVVGREMFDPPTALLCSEASPAKCHRRLVVEYLNSTWRGIEAIHL